MEELASLSFEGAWDPEVEWEVRIPPLRSEWEWAELSGDFRREEPELRRLFARLADQTLELLELEDLLARVQPDSPEHYRIHSALNERYYQNEEFLKDAERFESLHGKLSTIRDRVLDWESRRDAEVLSGSLSSLELDDSSSCSSSTLWDPSLPPLPLLPSRPSPGALRARATKTPRLNPDASDFVPAVRTGACPATPSPSPSPPTPFLSAPKGYPGSRTPLRSVPALFNLHPVLSPFPLIPLTYPVKATFAPPAAKSRARKRLNLRH